MKEMLRPDRGERRTIPDDSGHPLVLCVNALRARNIPIEDVDPVDASHSPIIGVKVVQIPESATGIMHKLISDRRIITMRDAYEGIAIPYTVNTSLARSSFEPEKKEQIRLLYAVRREAYCQQMAVAILQELPKEEESRKPGWHRYKKTNTDRLRQQLANMQTEIRKMAELQTELRRQGVTDITTSELQAIVEEVLQEKESPEE